MGNFVVHTATDECSVFAFVDRNDFGGVLVGVDEELTGSVLTVVDGEHIAHVSHVIYFPCIEYSTALVFEGYFVVVYHDVCSRQAEGVVLVGRFLAGTIPGNLAVEACDVGGVGFIVIAGRNIDVDGYVGISIALVQAILGEAYAGNILIDVYAVISSIIFGAVPRAVRVAGNELRNFFELIAYAGNQVVLGGYHGGGCFAFAAFCYVDAEVAGVVTANRRGVQHEELIVVGEGYTTRLGDVGGSIIHQGVVAGGVYIPCTDAAHGLDKCSVAPGYGERIVLGRAFWVQGFARLGVCHALVRCDKLRDITHCSTGGVKVYSVHVGRQVHRKQYVGVAVVIVAGSQIMSTIVLSSVCAFALLFVVIEVVASVGQLDIAFEVFYRAIV